MGVEPVCLDVFDKESVISAMIKANPQVVMHQLTDLPAALDPQKMSEGLKKNAHLREVGTANLIAGAIAAGAKRLIAQSICFNYAPGPLPHEETDPLDLKAEGDRGVTVKGTVSMEEQVMNAPLEGIVQRYGLLYGPHTGFDEPSGDSPLHVDAAAYAAYLAASKGPPGIYNFAETEALVTCSKAKRELGWSADWRASL